MAKHTIPTKALNRLFQILDGSFPSGSFVHSFGLEPHILMERVSDVEELRTFLHNLITHQYQGGDFAFVKRIHRAFEKGQFAVALREDNRYGAMLTYEYAKASRELGSNYLKQIDGDIKKKRVRLYFDLVREGKTFGHELAVLTAYAYELEIPVELFLALWCKKSILNIAMASLKISRIQPSQIQRMLFTFDEKIDELVENSTQSVSLFNPLFEEVIYRHKSLEPKLFAT
jgi:urease accessory protein